MNGREPRHIVRYRRMVRAFLPGSLQLEAEQELVETFDAAYHRVASRGPVRRSLFWAHNLLDLVVTSVSERLSRGGGWVLDLRHVVRGLAASRGYTAVAILSLAIGIGANSAVFSVIRALLLDEMPVAAPRELVMPYWHQPGSFRITSMNSSGFKEEGSEIGFTSNYSYPVIRAMRSAAPAGVGVAGFNFMNGVSVQVGDAPAQAAGGMLADGSYFDVVRPPVAIGRVFGEADDREDAPPVAVLSHRLWMRVFGGDPSVVGRVLRVNRVPTEIVGVTAAGFEGLSKGGFFPRSDITLPLAHAALYQPQWAPSSGSLLATETVWWVRAIARVPAPMDRTPVAAALASAITPRMAGLSSTTSGPARVHLVDGSRGLDQTDTDTRRLLYMLMGVVLVVLTIACVNLASLMLARGVSRQRELSVRRALGAGRARLLRVLVLEAAVLAAAGGVLGLVLTWWSRAALTTILTAGLGTAAVSQQPIEAPVDLRLVAVTFALSMAAAVVFSVLPALRLTREKAMGDLRQQVVGERSPRLALGRLLVALQIAVTVPLIVGALLFLRTVSSLGRVELGFDPHNVALFRLDPTKAVDEAEHARVYLDVLEKVRAIPGVTSASLMENALLTQRSSNATAVVDGKSHRVRMNAVGPDFVETLGLRLLAGRMPGVQDGPGAPRVAAINQAAVARLFGGRNPIGQPLTASRTTWVIVGVVSDALYESQRGRPQPTLFDSALQRPGWGGHHVVVRSSLDPRTLESQLQRAVISVHRDLTSPEIRTQLDQMKVSTLRERVFAQTLTIFGGFTVLLAAIGLHGVTSYAVRRRTREMGVRMALGARRGDVVWMIQRNVIVLAALGVAAGVPLSLWLGPLVKSLLFGVAPDDKVVVLSASLVMLVTAILSGLLPARRAASMDPLKALRTE